MALKALKVSEEFIERGNPDNAAFAASDYADEYKALEFCLAALSPDLESGKHPVKMLAVKMNPAVL